MCILTCSRPLWLFLLPLLDFFFLPPLDRARSQGDETTMLSISRPSWGYRKIKTQVPRPWQTTPLQHQCVVTSISSPTTEATPTAAFVSPAHLTVPGLTPCPFPSLPRWCSLARRRWLHLSCCHPRRSCKLLQTLPRPTTGQCPKRISETNDQVTSC